MGILLALASALTYGTADFLGGIASRRANVLTVLLSTQAVGLIGLLLIVPWMGDAVLVRDMAIGTAGGLAGILGLFCFYRALALGPMSVTAPLSAVTSALVPLITGLALGERPGISAALGVPLALVAIVLFSQGSDEEAATAHPDTPSNDAPVKAIVLAITAGFGFGTFLVALDKVSPEAGLWPVVAGRSASVVVVLAACFAGRTALALPRSVRRIAIPCGIGDTSANVLILFANRHGLLSIISVVSSLYPVATVVLAQTVLRERFTRIHAIGALAAFTAVILVALA